MVEARGHVVRSIPYYEWCALDSLEQQQAYVWRLLASAIPPSAQLDIPVQVLFIFQTVDFFPPSQSCI